MIQLKSAREIDLMAEGGRILAGAIDAVKGRVAPGVSTLELDEVADAYIRRFDGALPAFKGLYGFPRSICLSINSEVVHGIPSKKRVLEAGDLLSIDIGVQYKGFFTDAAITVPVGPVDETSRQLLSITAQALDAGIAAATVENHIGDIDQLTAFR